MNYFLHIFYLLTLISSCWLRDINLGLEIRAKVQGLTDVSKDVSDRRSFKQRAAVPDKIAEASSSNEEDKSSKSDSTDEKTTSTTRTTRRHRKTQKHTKETTAFTTKYERGTTWKHNRKSFSERHTHRNKNKHHSRKTKPEYIKSRNGDAEGLAIDVNIARELGDYVYTYVNSTVNAKGEKQTKVIIYNQTHYLQYRGNVIPSDYVQLFKLWTQLSGAKEFDDNFKPPWWMEWHKPPWWMDWHKPPAKLSNDSWDLWNEPGMLPPPPWLEKEEKKFDVVALLRSLLSNIKINDVQITSWKKVGANSITPEKMKRHTTSRQLPSKTVSAVDIHVPHDVMKRLGQLWRWVKNSGNLVESRSFQAQPQKIVKRSEKNNVNTSVTRFQTGPHSIKDDKEINTFTKQLMNSTLKIFDNVRNRSNEYYWKKDMKHLARLYEDKYKEFLRDTKEQKIQSELGAQKVILNAIDVSNRLVWRLLNFKTAEMDRSGLLRYGQSSNVMFQKEIKNEKSRQLKKACSELGICRSGRGIVQLMIDVLQTMRTLDDEKFKQAFDSLTEALKNADFKEGLGDKGDEALKYVVRRYESTGVAFQRAVVTILRNIIRRRNSPLVVPRDMDPSGSKTMATLAFHEILNKMDEKVPYTLENISTWNSIRNDMNSFAKAGTPNIQDVMQRFVLSIQCGLDNLDVDSLRIIQRNVKKIVG